MSSGDIILFPVYLIIISLFFRFIRKKYDDPLLKKYHKQGFWIKITGCVAYIIYSIYLSPGDSIYLYQKEGNAIYHLILNDSNNFYFLFHGGEYFDISLLADRSNAGYFNSDANFTVIKIVAFLSFFTMGKYALTSLLFACIAFSGVWKLFLFFYKQNPKMHKQFAIAILYFPTFVFWSSGILKDTLCIASIGWITYALYEMLYRKKNFIKNTFILFTFGYLLVVIKVYIILAYVPFFILFIILKNIQEVKSSFFKVMLAPSLIALSMFAFTQVLSSYNDELGRYAMEDVTTSISSLNTAFENQNGREDAASNFNLGAEFDGSFSGLIKIAPIAIATTFFRPFIWEAHKISQLMAAMESLALAFLTLYIIFKSGIRTIIKLILTDPLIMYCFLFSIVFALFVGASTLNFGTLVRYKIPCLPFYTIAMFLIYEKVKERSARKKLRQSTVSPESSITLTPTIA